MLRCRKEQASEATFTLSTFKITCLINFFSFLFFSLSTSILISLVSSSHFTGRREESTIETETVVVVAIEAGAGAAAPKLNLGDVSRRHSQVYMSQESSLHREY